MHWAYVTNINDRLPGAGAKLATGNVAVDKTDEIYIQKKDGKWRKGKEQGEGSKNEEEGKGKEQSARVVKQKKRNQLPTVKKLKQ